MSAINPRGYRISPTARDVEMADRYFAATAPKAVFDPACRVEQAAFDAVTRIGRMFGIDPSPHLIQWPTVAVAAAKARRP